jgi:hypothetical protein
LMLRRRNLQLSQDAEPFNSLHQSQQIPGRVVLQFWNRMGGG